MRGLRFGFVFLFFMAFTVGVSGQEPGPLLDRIAFGSCAQQERPQPIWNAIVQTKPNLFLFLGDNIYGDTESMKVMRDKYAKLAAMPGYQKLLKTCSVMATWDDHDFGVNDGGHEYPKRVESQKEFLDFFSVAKDSPRRKRAGVYHAEVFGPPDKRVQIIMLDTRYFRSPLKTKPKRVRGVGPYIANNDPKTTVLGEAQWKWLEEQLRVPAKLRIIGSSIQVVSEEHGWEKWTNHPHERDRLYKLIRDTKAAGVVFLSGDRHHAEIAMMDGGVGYPLYDLTSSGLNQGFPKWRQPEPNKHRVAVMFYGNNFGLITIDWKQPDPLLRFQIRDEDGEIIIQQKVPLSVLKPGVFDVGSYMPILDDGTTLTAARIKALMGKKVTIEMQVRATGMAKSLMFLNSAPDRRHKDNFTIVLPKYVQTQLANQGIADVRKYFDRKTIRVYGKLSQYNGQNEIFVRAATQIAVKK